jgi:hypothetical protein
MTDLEPACQFLSIRINGLLSRDIRLRQERFIDTILERFQMENCNRVAIPISFDVTMPKTRIQISQTQTFGSFISYLLAA